jgi:hypothetical protein
MEKACFKCLSVKPLDAFYKHSMMADGHLNKCKACTKKDSLNRYSEKVQDPSWKESERTRGREKFRRLYRESPKPYVRHIGHAASYEERFPEIKAAHSISGSVPKIPGFHNHHWSYALGNARDIIRLTKDGHYEAHRYLIYRQEFKCFASAEGVILDTREKHVNYLEQILIACPQALPSSTGVLAGKPPISGIH